MVSVIIAHFQNIGNLEKCLESVLAQTYSPKEVIVVDNSGGKSVENHFIRKFFIVKFINPGQNLLCSLAYNLGIRESQGEFLMFLNDDVILKEDFVSQLVEGFKNSENIGMTCGKILRLDKTPPLEELGGSIPVDKVTIDTAGQFLGKDRRPIERGWQMEDQGQHDYFSYIFSPGGVAPLYRRETLEDIAVNGECFDEDFKIFYEDLDLAWRANRFGWRSLYSPLALAYHQRGASTQTEKPRFKFLRKYYFSCMQGNLQFHLVKNRYLTMIKNDSIKSFLLNLSNILVYEVKLWGYILLFQTKLVLDLIKNRRFFGIAWEKRKIIKKNLSAIQRTQRKNKKDKEFLTG